MEKIFFNSWQTIFRTSTVAVMACFAVIFTLRLPGKRTVSQINAFGFLITAAMGSSFAAVALDSNVLLVDGILLIFLLFVMQYLFTWFSVRVKPIKNTITICPTLLVFKDWIIPQAMKKERITINNCIRRLPLHSLLLYFHRHLVFFNPGSYPVAHFRCFTSIIF